MMGFEKHSLGLALLVGLGLVFLATGAGAAESGERSRLSQDFGQGAATAPLISIPAGLGQPVGLYDLVVDSEGRANPGKTKVKAGTVLKLRSYVVSKSLLEAHDGVIKKGSDMPAADAIRKALNGGDNEAFLRVVGKLGELRRGAGTPQEREQAEREFPDEPDSAYLFGSGFVEVSGEGLKSAKADLRYFVPIAEVTRGAAKLDLAKARLEVLRGLTVHVFRELADTASPAADVDSALGELKRLGKGLEDPACIDGECRVPEALKAGDLAFEIAAIHGAGNGELYTDKSSAILLRRKAACFLRAMVMVCPQLRFADKVRALIEKEKVDCAKPASLLSGLETF